VRPSQKTLRFLCTDNGILILFYQDKEIRIEIWGFLFIKKIVIKNFIREQAK